MHISDISNKNLNPTFLFAIKYDRTEDGFLHSHDYIELLYIYDGEGKYEIDGVVYDVCKGNLLIINPGTDHANIVTDKEHPLVILALGFTDVHFKGMEKNEIVFDNQAPVLHTDMELRQQITTLFFHMLAEKEQKFPGKYDMMRLYLSQILIYVIRAFLRKDEDEQESTMKFISHNRKHVVKTLLDYMEQYYDEKISLEGMASDMYLSPVYISKIFKEETGESPIHHLIEIRLERAIALMREHPEYSIKKISEMVGYEDAYHFSKIFKKHLSVTPSEYRKKYSKRN